MDNGVYLVDYNLASDTMDMIFKSKSFIMGIYAIISLVLILIMNKVANKTILVITLVLVILVGLGLSVLL